MKFQRWIMIAGVVSVAGTMLLSINLGYACACKRKTTGYFQQIGQPSPVAANNQRPGIYNSLTGGKGDPQAGRLAILNRKKGNCLACHKIGVLNDAPYHGDIGPALDGVARRYNEAQLRQMVVDARVYFPKTPMPSFHVKEGLYRVISKFEGKFILSGQEVEDIVAFLGQLS